MQAISHIAWRRLPADLRGAILRQVARDTAIGSTPDQLPIDDHLRTRLVAELSSHSFRPRVDTNPSLAKVTATVLGARQAIEWWSKLSTTDRGKLVESLYRDVI